MLEVLLWTLDSVPRVNVSSKLGWVTSILDPSWLNVKKYSFSLKDALRGSKFEDDAHLLHTFKVGPLQLKFF